MEACARYGVELRDGTGVAKKDPGRALALETKACDGKYGGGCNVLGWAYRKGTLGMPRDDKKAIEMFRKACDLGSGLGCGSLADSYEHGDGVDADVDKAKELYAQACTLKDLPSCDDAKRLAAPKPAAKEENEEAMSCDYGKTKCTTPGGDVSCADLDSDNQNCGECNNACDSHRPLCKGGICDCYEMEKDGNGGVCPE
jgi:TPR repeat protein